MLDRINIFTVRENVAARAADKLNELLGNNKNNPILLLLGTGTSLEILPFVNTGLFGPHVTISVTDDRFSNDPKVSTFLRLAETSFYKQALLSGAKSISTVPQTDETLLSLVARFEVDLLNWFSTNPSGIVISVLEVGPDGHLAGVISNPEYSDSFFSMFLDPKHLVVGYNAGSGIKYPERITVTLYFLKKHVSSGIVLLTGSDKLPVLESIMDSAGELSAVPARILQNMPSVFLFTNLEYMR